jgi:hypothetical protein
LRRSVLGLATLAFVACHARPRPSVAAPRCTEDCPRDLDGCKTSGEPLWWANSCVGFSLQRDASVHIPIKYVRQVATRSFTAWSDLECETGYATLAFSELEEAECKRTEYNDGGKNSNIILFQDNKWDYKGADNTLAKTTVTFDAETGEIFDADIEINHAYNNFTISDEIVDYDLESVLTHEVGHLIGLDHTPTTPPRCTRATSPARWSSARSSPTTCSALARPTPRSATPSATLARAAASARSAATSPMTALSDELQPLHAKTAGPSAAARSCSPASRCSPERGAGSAWAPRFAGSRAASLALLRPRSRCRRGQTSARHRSRSEGASRARRAELEEITFA